MGTLISDGYSAYASYIKNTAKTTHAQCWAHTRRQFFNAKEDEPALVDEMLERIGRLYAIEDEIDKASLSTDAIRAYRLDCVYRRNVTANNANVTDDSGAT